MIIASLELVSVDFRVTDTLLEGSDKAQNKAALEVFPAMVDAVTECLSFPPTRKRPWGLPGETWDLSQGGQVNLLQGTGVIVLQFWWQRLN